jgi:hypothetical protein
MILGSKHPFAWSVFRLLLLLAWFCIVVSYATMISIYLAFLIREHISSEPWRSAAVYGCTIIAIAQVVLFGFLLPSWILKRRARVEL